MQEQKRLNVTTHDAVKADEGNADVSLVLRMIAYIKWRLALGPEGNTRKLISNLLRKWVGWSASIPVIHSLVRKKELYEPCSQYCVYSTCERLPHKTYKSGMNLRVLQSASYNNYTVPTAVTGISDEAAPTLRFFVLQTSFRDTTLQAWRLRIRFSMKSLHFSLQLIFPAALSCRGGSSL